jgi:alpha-L-fucosidase
MTTRRSFLAATAGTVTAGVAGLIRTPAAVTGSMLSVGRQLVQERPRPSPSQLLWQRDELAMFIHFGINTFTDREWGDGTEDPMLFTPTDLDARQWARVARSAGFRAMVLTAKHHDGFCLWPTETTPHSVAASGWRGGSGDVVREFVVACRAEGLRVGLYCSPWDRNAPVYGDSPRYNDMFVDQLTELLTSYGPVHEVWFDGANGEGPNGRRQEYDWPRFRAVVRQLQPEAVVFSDAGPDVRWIGNEQGIAGDPNWSTVDPATVPVPGMGGEEVMRQLQHGDRDGTVWRPGETDVSIRPGWFHHPAEDDRVRSVDNLVDLYFTSVGRNSKLLLNVPPTRQGVLHEMDVARLAGMRARLDAIFAEELTRGGRADWRATGQTTAIGEIDVGREVVAGISDLREEIARGQNVAAWLLEGETPDGWTELCRGTTIGYRKLDRFEPTRVRRLRLTIEDAISTPAPVRLTLFA